MEMIDLPKTVNFKVYAITYSRTYKANFNYKKFINYVGKIIGCNIDIQHAKYTDSMIRCLNTFILIYTQRELSYLYEKLGMFSKLSFSIIEITNPNHIMLHNCKRIVNRWLKHKLTIKS